VFHIFHVPAIYPLFTIHTLGSLLNADWYPPPLPPTPPFPPISWLHELSLAMWWKSFAPKQQYKHVWVLEDDIRYAGNLRDFFERYASFDHDYLGSYFQTSMNGTNDPHYGKVRSRCGILWHGAFVLCIVPRYWILVQADPRLTLSHTHSRVFVPGYNNSSYFYFPTSRVSCHVCRSLLLLLGPDV
jgi:hypothetical protein